LKKLLQNHVDTFAANPDAPKVANVEPFEIDTGTAKPVSRPPYRMDPIRAEYIAHATRTYLARGLIEPSRSPWSTLALKQNNGIRFCMDYRGLNEVTIKDKYPLPNIDDAITHLGGAKY
jgi:hypothetical protein